MAIFCERLKELLIDREIKPDKLAKDIGVAVQTVYSWKADNQQIILSHLLLLCNYLKCSIDFIAGRSEIEMGFLPQAPLPFHKAIRAMMEHKKISSYRLRNDTRYGGSYFVRWDKGAEPYLSTLMDLAKYFDCTIDELVGREKLTKVNLGL